MNKVILVISLSCLITGCSSIDEDVLSNIIPDKYTYKTLKTRTENAVLFGDPSVFYVLEFENSIFSRKNEVFENSRIRLADDNDRIYFISSVLPGYGESAKFRSSLFRMDVCHVVNSKKECEEGAETYSVYLLVESSGRKAYVEVLAF